MSVEAQSQDYSGLKRAVVRELNNDKALKNATIVSISSLGVTIGGDLVGARPQSLISA